MGVQHQFLQTYGFTINYVGTHGVKGYTREDYNRFAGDVCNAVTRDFFINRLNPGWGSEFYTSNESNSIYHGLNAQLRKAYSRGFTWTANYTFGKVLDNVTEGNLGDYFNVNAYAGAYTGVQDIAKPGARPWPFRIRCASSFYSERRVGLADFQRRAIQQSSRWMAVE